MYFRKSKHQKVMKIRERFLVSTIEFQKISSSALPTSENGTRSTRVTYESAQLWIVLYEVDSAAGLWMVPRFFFIAMHLRAPCDSRWYSYLYIGISRVLSGKLYSRCHNDTCFEIKLYRTQKLHSAVCHYSHMVNKVLLRACRRIPEEQTSGRQLWCRVAGGTQFGDVTCFIAF